MTVTGSVRSIAGAIRSPAIARWLRVVGPAWVVMLADVDAPSVITAGQGGTVSGYALLLPLFAIVPILFLVQEMTARLALATGKGHAELVRVRYGPRWAAVSVAGHGRHQLRGLRRGVRRHRPGGGDPRHSGAAGHRRGAGSCTPARS